MTNSVEEIVARVLAELKREGLEPHSTKDAPQESRVSNVGGDLIIDLADPTLDGPRHAIGVDHPAYRAAIDPVPAATADALRADLA